MLHSYSDNKKRCSLMLSLFEPGSQSVPWLGNLKQLGAINETEGDASSKVEETPFPIAASSQRSYRSQSQAVWIKPSGLQVTRTGLLKPFTTYKNDASCNSPHVMLYTMLCFITGANWSFNLDVSSSFFQFRLAF